MHFSIQTLEKAFSDIQKTSMRDMPVINTQLSVKAIDFQEWGNYQLGILITPWFMNVLLIPHDDSASLSHIGTTQQHAFPSGSYEFVTNFEDAIGYYLSCSLFSPMFDFENQEAAELTATEALKALMQEENRDIASENPTKEIKQIWNGEIPKPIPPKNMDDSETLLARDQSVPRKKLSERLNEPTSRRDFLRGKAFREESVQTTEPKEPLIKP